MARSAAAEPTAEVPPGDRTILVTRRLTLRPPLEVDLDAIAAGLNDMEVARWLGTVPHPYGRSDARHWLETMERGEADRRWTVHDARGLVGVVSIRVRASGGSENAAKLGYWFARPFWGRGYGSEAVAAVVADHFERGGEDLVASAHEGNAGSLAIQRRLGFATVGQDRAPSLARGEDVPVVVNRLARSVFERRAADGQAA